MDKVLYTQLQLQGCYENTPIKASKNYILRAVAGENMIVPIGQGIANFSGVISANASAAFLWNKLQNEITQGELEQMLVEEYEISVEQAKEDVKNFLSVLSQRNMLEVTNE